MTIDRLIEVMKSYDFEVNEKEVPDLSFHMRQVWDGVKEPHKRNDRTWLFRRIRDKSRDILDYKNRIEFNIFENRSVYSKGIHYEEEGKVFYFLSVGQYISEVFQQDELELLLKDWYDRILKEFKLDEIRDFKLNRLLYE
jgi:hypothetical protein